MYLYHTAQDTTATRNDQPANLKCGLSCNLQSLSQLHGDSIQHPTFYIAYDMFQTHINTFHMRNTSLKFNIIENASSLMLLLQYNTKPMSLPVPREYHA